MKTKITMLLVGAAMALSFLTGCESDSGGSSSSSKHPTRCEVTFKNYNADILFYSSVEYGGTAVYQGETPVRPSDGAIRYYFSGWDRPLENVKSDTTFIAQYTTKPTYFNISWVNYDDELLTTTQVEYGATPTYVGTTPSRPDDFEYTYTFTGWEPEIVPAIADATYKATYEAEKIVDGSKAKVRMLYNIYSPRTGELVVSHQTAPSDLGSVSSGGEYDKGEYIDVSAYPFNGYEFVGWYYEGRCLSTQNIYRFKVWSHDIELEARFRFAFFELTLESYQPDRGYVSAEIAGNQYGYTTSATYNVYYTEEVNLFAYTSDTTRFIGWYRYESTLVSNNAAYTYTMPSSDVTIKGKWDYFRISYDLNGGSMGYWDYETSYQAPLNSDDQYYVLPTPTRTGYNFDGWYVNDSYYTSTKLDKSQLIDYHCVASWSPITYTIEYDMNGGDGGEMESQTATYDVYVTISKCGFTKTGYKFKYWSTDPNDTWSSSRYYADSEVWNLASEQDATVTLYAIWELGYSNVTLYNVDPLYGNGFNVKFVTNGADQELNDLYLRHGDRLYNPGVLTKDGYNFTGWYTNEECTALYNFSSSLTSDLTLYAGWLTTGYTYSTKNTMKNPARYNSENNTYKTAVTGTQTSDPNMIYLLPDITSTTYLYMRKTSEDCNIYVSLYDYTANSDILVSKTQYIDYSYYTINFTRGHVYGLTVHKSSFSYSNYLELYFSNIYESTPGVVDRSYFTSTTLTYGSLYSFQVPSTMDRDYCEFAGWYDAEGNQYTDQYGASITEIWTKVDDVELYPHWSYTALSVNYVLDGGTNSSKNPSEYTIISNITLSPAEKEHYDFIGWYLEDTFETQVTVLNANLAFAKGSITLYAKWEAVKYEVTLMYGDLYSPSHQVSFDANGGVFTGNDQTVSQYDGLVYPTTAPTRSGYVFTGWYQDKECLKFFDFTDYVTHDTTVYAGWAEMGATNYHTRVAINPIAYNSSSNVYTSSQSGTYSSSKNYYYFAAMSTSTFYLNYKTSSTSTYYRIYISVYDETAQEAIISNYTISSTSFTGRPISATKGHVYYIATSCYNSSYNPTLSLYFSDFGYPNAGGTSANYATTIVSYGQNYNLGAPQVQGYTFLGWYTGNDTSYTQYADENGNSLAPYALEYGITLYAVWTYNN